VTVTRPTEVLLILALFAGLPLSAAAPALAQTTVLIEAEEFSSLYDFYRTVLALPLSAGDGGGGRAVFDADGTRIVLLRRGISSPQRVTPRILIAVPDLEAARGRLNRENVPHNPVFGPRDEPVALFFEDPEGNPLGFVAPRPDPRAWLDPLRIEGLERDRIDSGRIHLMVAGGLLGVWEGIALPIGLGSEDETVIGLSILAGGPLGVLAAHAVASGSDVTVGRAGVINLAGMLGIWQGLGWADEANVENGDRILLSGALTSLGAAVAATVLTHDVLVSQGQATVLSSAAAWGGWYGLVGSAATDEFGDVDHRTMMISALGGLGLGTLWALNNDIDAGRARLITLGGVIGAGTGAGIAVTADVTESEDVLLMAGIGSLAGKIASVYLTRNREAAPEDRGGNETTLETPFQASLGPDGVLFTLLRMKL